jgi:hypothetical protein
MVQFRLAVILSLLTGACAAYNSSSGDEGQYLEAVIDTGGDPNFAVAFGVVQNRCMGCHASWSNLTSNALWIASGYVKKGQASNSILITRTYRNGTGDMPPSNTMTQAEFDSVKNWINDMP